MDHHQRLQRQTVDSSLKRLPQSSLQASSFQTQGFGVQKKAATSAPKSKTELWDDYLATKQLCERSARALSIQAKLKIGQPGDKYEQEADSVAERVMAMSEPALVQREELPEEEEELKMKPLAETISPLVQREVLPQEEEELQMKPEDNVTQRESFPEEKNEELQMKSVHNSIQREELSEEEEKLQMKESPTPNSQLPTSSLEDRLSSSKGGGSPLSNELRSFMEPRFGADFSGVRVHTGSDAMQMNRDVNAQAFAYGSDIYFGAGKAPGKNALTAHELTHVVQQSPKPSNNYERQASLNSLATTPIIRRGGNPDDSLEYGAKALDLGQLDSSSKKVLKGSSKLLTIAQKIKEKGTNALWANDKSLLQNAQQLTDLSKALSNVGTGLTDLLKSASGKTFKQGDPIFENASKLCNIANVIGSGIEAENALDDLHADPHNYDKAKKWARSLGDVFEKSNKLIELIPDGVLPGFIQAYWKGLLSAPTNYIEAFITIMEIHYGKLDKETGISGATRRATQGDKILWEGDLTSMYSAACFVQPFGTLDQFMNAHQQTEGVDLWKASIPIGKKLLLNAIEREIPLKNDPNALQDPRRLWIPWIESQPNAVF